MTPGGDRSVAVCICTRNRPAELERALASVAGSTVPVRRVIVADDSTDARTAELVGRHPRGELVEGPRAGLAANRNAALSRVDTTHVLFLDDDAELAPGFLATALSCIERAADPGRTIATGRERQPSGLVEPRAPTFLGHQARPYGRGERLSTIVINATLFPVDLFRVIRFDPQLVYGYEEADLASRAAAEGFEIAYCPAAVNAHSPAPGGRADRGPQTEASRLYATWKRYSRTERRRARAGAFLAVAGAHCVAGGLMRGRPGDSARSLRTASRCIARLRSDPGLDRC